MNTIRTVLREYIAVFGPRRLAMECAAFLVALAVVPAGLLVSIHWATHTASTANPSPAVEDAVANGREG